MKPIVIRIAWACALLVLGWAAGQAQGIPEPQFVLEIEAPQGMTTITCARGCELIGSRDHGNGSAARLQQYTYGCGVRVGPDGLVIGLDEVKRATPLRCKGTVFGWRKD